MAHMTKKTATPDEMAKLWGELNAHRVLIHDIYAMLVQYSDQPDEIEDIKRRTLDSLKEVPFPPEHEDTRSAAKVALDQFWHDFGDSLKAVKQ